VEAASTPAEIETHLALRVISIFSPLPNRNPHPFPSYRTG
jgi:hypothetical protein